MTSYREIGEWSEAKLDIIREYGHAYSKIMSHPKRAYLRHVYIDAFAGSGTHVARSTKQHVRGSPLNALNVKPPFEQYYFIDKNSTTVRALSEAVGHRSDVVLCEGDANTLLLDDVYPRITY